jgi:hypothetical protein
VTPSRSCCSHSPLLPPTAAGPLGPFPRCSAEYPLRDARLLGRSKKERAPEGGDRRPRCWSSLLAIERPSTDAATIGVMRPPHKTGFARCAGVHVLRSPGCFLPRRVVNHEHTTEAAWAGGTAATGRLRHRVAVPRRRAGATQHPGETMIRTALVGRCAAGESERTRPRVPLRLTPQRTLFLRDAFSLAHSAAGYPPPPFGPFARWRVRSAALRSPRRANSSWSRQNLTP